MPLTDDHAAKLRGLKIGDVLRPSHVEAIAAVLRENAALREVLAALADDAYDNAGWRNIERNECNYCMADVVSAEGEPVDCDHGYGCPVARARALLTAQPAPDAPPIAPQAP